MEQDTKEVPPLDFLRRLMAKELNASAEQDIRLAMLLEKRRAQSTSHILHLLLSLLTAGLWLPVWLLVGVSHAIERRRIDAKIARLNRHKFFDFGDD